ncbi:chaperone CsaA [soil metagenome]
MNKNTHQLIHYEDFDKVHICVGTIIQAKANEQAKKPAFILEIDFGPLGTKTSSAQITEHYDVNSLIGQQIIAVMNFPTKRIAGIKSEVLVLASVSAEKGTVLMQPTMTVPNGSRIS